MSALIILAITVAGPRIGIVATTAVLIAAQFTLADRDRSQRLVRRRAHRRQLATTRGSRPLVRRRSVDPAEMSVLEGLEPAGVWVRFAELTRIARPPKEEAAAREHVLDWARDHGFESAVDEEGNVVVRVPASDGRDARAHGCAPGAPGHGVRAGSRQPLRPPRGTNQRRSRQRLGRRRRDDARRGQRDRRRGCARCRRGHGSRSRSARAALHGVRGAGSRRGEEPRRVARLRTTPTQSGRDERQGHHHWLRRQLAHVHAPPARPRGGPGGSRRAGGRRVGRARRSLGRRHRPRTCQRDQGARSRSQRGVPRGTVPPRAPRRRRESQRSSPRSAGGDLALA